VVLVRKPLMVADLLVETGFVATIQELPLFVEYSTM
jgi:hypothetical protein